MRQSQRNGGPGAPESVWSALVHVYETGQQLLLERIELAKLEVIGFARVELVVIAQQLVRNLVLALAGGILLIAGWFVLTWGLVSLSAAALPVAWRLVIEAGLNLALGGVLVWLAVRQRPQSEAEAVSGPVAIGRLEA
jgi:predicted phage tail protein